MHELCPHIITRLWPQYQGITYSQEYGWGKRRPSFPVSSESKETFPRNTHHALSRCLLTSYWPQLHHMPWLKPITGMGNGTVLIRVYLPPAQMGKRGTLSGSVTNSQLIATSSSTGNLLPTQRLPHRDKASFHPLQVLVLSFCNHFPPRCIYLHCLSA